MKNFDLKEALRKKKIVPFSDGPKVASKEIATAKDDLKDAKDVLALGKTKLATVSAYYAIFHATRALLFMKNYREKSHIQLGLAVKALFVDTGILPIEYYDNFIQALNLREMADYKRTFSKEGAEKNIEAAEKAIEQATGGSACVGG